MEYVSVPRLPFGDPKGRSEVCYCHIAYLQIYYCMIYCYIQYNSQFQNKMDQKGEELLNYEGGEII